MKEIKNVDELDLGENYHLINKRNGDYIGIHPYQSAEEQYHFFATSGAGNRMWTYEGNNEGMELWHIFGPVNMDEFTAEDAYNETGLEK